MTPYIDLCPSDPLENLWWRVRMRAAAARDAGLQEAIRQACFSDVLFFFQSMMWLIEPRSTIKVLPFCLWPHQIPAILTLEDAIASSELNLDEPMDVVIDKSRAQGASWICLGVILRRWLRDSMFMAGLVSKSMDAADNADDPDSLMSKLDWAIKMLPWWMKPVGHNPDRDRLYSKHSWVNPDTGGSIIAYAATGDVASGGRKTVFLFDEVAKFEASDAQDALNSTQFVTNCRFFVSTHKGDKGVFYDMVYGDSGGKKIVLDWQQNPTHTRLAYRIVGGSHFPLRENETQAVRKYISENKLNLEKLKRRGFLRDGRLRSPWYDRQCLRPRATPRSIAQELDRDPRGTVGKLFPSEVLDEMQARKVRTPLWEGRATVRDDVLHLTEQVDGPLKLWFELGLANAAPVGKYAVGADVATGGGVEEPSNSALVAGNARTGEQVLEYTDPAISETRFARLAVAICKWLGNAQLIWEAQGPTGKRFATTVMQELGYGNVWLRPKEGSIVRGSTGNRAGWNNNRTSDKADLFEDFWVAMDEDQFLPRSDALLKECGGWEWDSEKIIYKGTGHGDRSIAGGLCWKVMKDFQQMGLDKEEKIVQTAPYGTLAWRIEKQKRIIGVDQDDGGSGDFTIKELLHMN